jgi:hypothetical protein
MKRMTNFSLILRNIVFLLFPVPFVLNFAIAHGNEWPGYVAYMAVAVLVVAAAIAGWAVWRQRRGR